MLVKESENPGDEPSDITPKDFSVRNTTQEYGGGAFTVAGDIVVFSNYKDQRLYKQSLNSGEPTIDLSRLLYVKDGVDFLDLVLLIAHCLVNKNVKD